MKTLITKAKSLVSSSVLFLMGCVMAGVGLATIGLLTLFALFALGVALLAAPFVALAQTSGAPAEDDTVTAA